MINWNDIKNLDVKDFDLTRIDLSRLDVRHLNLPKIDLPKIDLPELSQVDVERVAGLARDAAYAGVGVAVITAQKLDGQRRELTDQVTARVRKLVDNVA